jgi:nucleoside-diphosphate-sugar epimerase
MIRKGRTSVTQAETFWTGKTVFVTGGASFIGSTLMDQLLARGVAKVRLVDVHALHGRARDPRFAQIRLQKINFPRGLQAYAKEHGMGAASCRYFTVYGPRGVENHAVIAMIAWEPKVLFREGLKRTIDWYYATRDRDEVQRIFARMLTER